MSEHDRVANRVAELAELCLGQSRKHHQSFLTIMEFYVKNLADLIDLSGRIKTERDSLIADRDTQKDRADKAQAAYEALMAQVSSDEATAGAALAALQGGGAAAGPTPVTAQVAAAITAPATTVVVTGDAAVPIGASLTGPGLADGTTAADVAVTTALDGSAVSTVTLSQPTSADHVGDGTEVVTATPVAAE